MTEWTKRENYENALGLLRGGEMEAGGIRKSLFPHIDDHTFKQVTRRMFESHSFSHQFFTPPLVIRGVAHVISVYRNAARADRAFMCSHSGTRRLPWSIERVGIGWEGYKRPSPTDQERMEVACQYAEDHWGDQLVDDRSVQIFAGHVIKQGDITTVGEFSATLGCSLPDLRKLHREPRSELLDDAIINISADRLIMEEMESSRRPWLAMFCSHCGGGITGDSKDVPAICNFCNTSFPLAKTGGQSWKWALPSKAIAALHLKGLRFGIDPNLARYREHINWAKDQQGDPLRRETQGELRNHRVIDLAEK